MPQNSSDPTDTSNASSGSSEFTQIFGKAPVPVADSPFAPETASIAGKPTSNSLNQDLAARPAPVQTSSKLFRETEPSEAPTQIFAAVPQASRPVHDTFASDETRIFGHPVAAQTPAANRPVVAPTSTPPAPPPMASEFTSVFQPIALPPSMPTPAAAPVAASGSGEFTQFFSAISARAGVGEPQGASAPAVPPPVVPTPAAPRAPAPQPQAGEFTQLFQQQQSLPKQPANTPAPVAQPVSAKPQGQNEPGSFTQLFSQAAVPPAPLPSAPPPMPVRAAEAAAPPASQPIFGAPAPRGSFTDIFPSSPVAQPMASTADTRFEDLFGPPSAPAFSPEPAMRASAPPPPFNPPAPSPVPAPPIAAAGEFTQLMNALERPASTAPTPAAPLPMDAAFFAHTPASSAGESEYTRVMRGGSAAAPARPPIGAPAAGSAATPGLALAPVPKEDSAKDKPAKEKPKLFVILLVVMNVLLLLALIVVGFVLLHRR